VSKKKKSDKAAKATTSGPHAAGSAALVARASFDAAGQGRRMAGWRPSSAGPNRAAAGLQTIRNRARDAARNEWTAAAAERVWGTNLIGTGIIARPTTRNAKLKALYADIWASFCTQADADGVLDFYGLQTLAVESWRTAGEVFIRLRPRRTDDGLRVPIQVQLLEADMVPILDADAWPGLPTGHRIRSGIELNRIGRRVAYWCYREHPADTFTTASHADLVRVPADQMRHLFKPARPGQLRGLPASTPVIAKRRSAGNYDDAVLHRQELSNLYTGFVTRPPEDAAPVIDPATGEVSQPAAKDAPLIGLEPGMLQELAPGEDIKFTQPPDAGANYPHFMRQQHLGIAAGDGIPYELLTGDLRDISDRTLRVILNDFRRTCEQYQWQLIIPMMCQFVRDAVARAAVLAGELTAEQGAEFARCTWHPHAWPYIHPTQDVQAKKMEKDAGLKSRAQLAAERGEDIEQIDAERAEDAARERRFKLTPEAPSPAST
jgi:lambda family phage portal protein